MMTRPPVLPTLTMLFALTSCAVVGPNYQEPDIAWLSTLEEDIYGTALTSAEASDHLEQWWQRFGDPELNGLIEHARRNSPTLRIAGLRVLESRALAAAAGALLRPQSQVVSADASYVERESGPGSDGFTTWSGGFAVGWELDFWGRFQRSIESADAGFFASVANQRDAQVLLAAQIAQTYWQYRVIQQRIDVVHMNVTRQRRSYDITRQMFESGQQSELDFQQARTQYLSTKAGLPALEQAEQQLKNALALLIGEPSVEIAPADPSTPLPSAEVVAVGELPGHLLQRRPDVRASLWQVAAQSAQIGVAESEFYPAIAIGGGVNIGANSLRGSSAATSIGAGPAINWTVFDWGRIENTVRVQDARLQQLIENYRLTVLAAARELADAVIAVRKTAEQKELLLETVAASERTLDLAQARYREGYADFQRVLDAQRVLFSQADRALQTEANHLSAIVELYKAIGGGWMPEHIDTMLDAKTLDTMMNRTDWGELIHRPVADPVKPTEYDQ